MDTVASQQSNMQVTLNTISKYLSSGEPNHSDVLLTISITHTITLSAYTAFHSVLQAANIETLTISLIWW